MNILLVEDDPGVGRFVSRGLDRSGYCVTWERTGKNAAKLLSEGSYAAALLDLGLPDIDGLDLCRDLRRARIDTPVLMLTARGELRDRLDGFDAGADDYLPKPFAFDELVARLGAIVRRATTTEPSFGPLVLHPSSRTASVGDTPLQLSRREYDLVARLVAGGGELVSRAEIAAAVWGDSPTTENALDVYVRYVRRRLSEIEGAPTIVTKRGEGFRLSL
jgi:DNA-binding response OmpR family regulator